MFINRKIKHFKFITTIAGVIFVGELLKLFILNQFAPLSSASTHILKAIFLIIVCTPAIYYFGFLQDKKRFEAEYESELQIANTVLQIRDALMITDAQGSILRVNAAFEQFTGYRQHEVIGKNPRILSSGRHDKDFYKKMWDKIISEGSWKGEIWDKSKGGTIYPKLATITAIKNKSNVTTNYVAVFTAISDRKKSEEEMFRLAYYDALTGIPNRRLLLDRLNVAQAGSARNNQYGAILFLDLDNFKAVNDTYGHQLGDSLLIEVADRIQASVREVDTVARLGGDEFVVLLQNLGSSHQNALSNVKKIAESLRAQLCKPYLKDSIDTISSSIGAEMFIGRSNVDELLEHADLAMYQAKKSGRNRVVFYETS